MAARSCSSGGDLAVTLYANPGIHELAQYVGGRWYVTARRCQVVSAAFTGRELVVAGWTCVMVGSLAPSGPVALHRLAPDPGAFQQVAVALAGGEVVVGNRLGAIALSNASGPVALPLGRMAVGPPSFSSPPGPGCERCTFPTSEPVSATWLSWGGARRAWFVPQGSVRLGLITQGT